MPPRMRTRSAGRPVAESRGGGTGEQVGKGERGRGPRGGNDDHVDELNGQGQHNKDQRFKTSTTKQSQQVQRSKIQDLTLRIRRPHIRRDS
ncbi:hypothetical protein Tco_0613996 [Tanacetum coccineum]